MDIARHTTDAPGRPMTNGVGWRTIQGRWVAMLVLFLLALGIRLVSLADAPVQFDELYHLLAARSWLHDGSFAIADGSYDRTRGYTVLVAWGMRLFGDGLVGARMPAVLAGAALAPAMFMTLDRAGGRLAGWIAGLAVAFCADAIAVSQFARFYALHALLFWIGCAAVHAVVVRGATPARIGCAALALAGALYLQVTTLIGLVGLGCWIGVAWGGPLVLRMPARRRVAVTVAAIVAAAIMAWAVGRSGAWSSFGHASLWAAHRRGDVAYYHHILAEQMPVLWFLLPMAGLLAMARDVRFASLSIAILTIGLGLHSLAGMKSERYISYLLPFLLAIWALAIAYLAPVALAWMRSLLAPFKAGSRWLAGPILLAVLAIGVMGNPAYSTTLRQTLAALRHVARGQPVPDPPWSRDRAGLAAALAVAPRGAEIVTTDELRTLYYFGRYDANLNRARLDELPLREDFGVDGRTGRPVIGSVAALRFLVRCHEDGLVLIGPEQFEPAPAIDVATRAYIRRTMRPVLLGGVWLYRWHTADPAPAASCRRPRS